MNQKYFKIIPLTLLYSVTTLFTGVNAVANNFFITHPHNLLTEQDQLPEYIPLNTYGSFVLKLKSNQNYTEQEIVNKFNELFKMSFDNKFIKISENVDALGFKHSTFQHYLGNYPVEGQMVIVHSKNDKVVYINGTVINIENNKSTYSLKTNLNKKPAITKERALEIVKNELALSGITEKKPVETVFYKADDSSPFILTQKVNIDETGATVQKKDVYVDVESGKIVGEISNIRHAGITGTGESFYRGTLPITITLDDEDGLYYLIDEERNITTLDATNANNIYLDDANEITSTTTVFTDSLISPAAIDVHWGMEKTYDYYKLVHNRLSFDNQNTEVVNIYNPAPWEGYQGFPFQAVAMPNSDVGLMLFGKGGEFQGVPYMNPVVALDVAGHEYSHLVIDNNGKGGLRYQGESGALNEAFADIFGTAIEFYSVDNPNWTVGEGIMLYGNYSYMRNMANPKENNLSDRQPDTYSGQYWASTTSPVDNGGVHTNSGVLNYWFYLVSEGGEGINDNGDEYIVQGIGIEKAEQIAFSTLMNFLTRNAQYVDVYEGSKNAVDLLYNEEDEDEDEYPEYNAVVDAWYAVGFGEKRPNMGVEDFEDSEEPFRIFPNPVIRGELNIVTNFEKGKVEFYSMTGQKVGEFTLNEKGEHKVNLEYLQKGTYILKLTGDNNKSHTEKIIVK
jgi:Zn-dependent metalloprotease